MRYQLIKLLGPKNCKSKGSLGYIVKLPPLENKQLKAIRDLLGDSIFSATKRREECPSQSKRSSNSEAPTL